MPGPHIGAGRRRSSRSSTPTAWVSCRGERARAGALRRLTPAGVGLPQGSGGADEGIPQQENALVQQGAQLLPVPLLQGHAVLQQGQLVTAVQAAHQLQRAVQGLGVACGLSLQLGGCPAKQALAAVGGGLPGRLGLVG